MQHATNWDDVDVREKEMKIIYVRASETGYFQSDMVIIMERSGVGHSD